MTNDELIALARVKATQSGHIESPTWRALTWSLIDALEAATAEHGTALEALIVVRTPVADAERQANAVERIIERGGRNEMTNEELITETRWLIEQFDSEDVEVSASWLRKLADTLESTEAELDKALTVIASGFITSQERAAGVRAEAWDEGAAAGTENTAKWDGWNHRKPEIMNPYRTNSEEVSL